MGDKKHAVLGASSSSRWLACPGSVSLSKGLPSKSSSYAKEGTAAHDVAEKGLRYGKNADDFLKIAIKVDGDEFRVTEEMADAVNLYLATVRSDLVGLDNATLHVEQSFNLDWLGGPQAMFGTNDAMICQPFGKLIVYDYKHGAGIAVEVEENPQMMYYALGAVGLDVYEEVELVIVQPRAQHHEGPVRRWSLSIEELMTWSKDVLIPGAWATQKNTDVLVAGGHCKFCRALAICPEQKRQAYAVAKNVFAEKPSAPPPVEKLSPSDLKVVLDKAPMIEAWFNACRAYAKDALEAGTLKVKDVGYKMVEGRKSRKWTDEKKVEAWLTSLIGEGAHKRKLISPAQAEKLLKGESKKAVAAKITETRGRQLVPISDKREAIPMKALAADVFGEVNIT